MKTLVIHPIDSTTDFLERIYKGKDWTVLRPGKEYSVMNVSKKEIKEGIKTHDRIIMLGHGLETGLIAPTNNYNGYRYIIDSSLVYLLREKECVCIWCNADEFVKKYDLKGFYTGMIISEYEESISYCIRTNDSQLLESNELFADSVAKYINRIPKGMFDGILSTYIGDTPVIDFNRKNIHYNG